jgi:hypothetical protein
MTSEKLGRPLIFVVLFLGLFIVLIATLPPEFLSAGMKEYQQYNVPSYFSAEDIQTIKYFKQLNLTAMTYFDFNPDINFKFYVQKFGWSGYPRFFAHVTWEFFGLMATDSLKIEYDDAWLYLDEALLNWDETVNASIFYPVACNHVTMKVWLTDRNISRNDLSVAWWSDELTLGMGFGYQDKEIKLSAWDIIGRLLTFQAPEIFGLSGIFALIVNVIVTLPFYTCIAYLVYRLILMAIPFVGG